MISAIGNTTPYSVRRTNNNVNFKGCYCGQSTRENLLGTAVNAAGSLVGKEVKFNLAHIDIQQLYKGYKYDKPLTVIKDNCGITDDSSGVRMIQFKQGDLTDWTAAERLNVVE